MPALPARHLTLAALAAGSLCSMAAPGSAAVSRCPLILDGRNDVSVGYAVMPVGAVTHPVDDPALDIRSADLVIGSSSVTAVIRVAALTSAPTEATKAWSFEFTSGRSSYRMQAERGADGERFTALRETITATPAATVVEYRNFSPATGSIDAARGEIRVTVPRSAFGADLARGRTLTELSAAGQHTLSTEKADVTGVTWGPQDHAPTIAKVVVGRTPACAR